MKQSSVPGVNNRKKFEIVLDSESYSKAERCGYNKAIFEGEEVKGNVELELAKPEMVKCIRLQLIGFITKSSRIDYQDVLKYVNNPENPGGTLQKALKPMKMLSIDSSSGSSNNNKNSSDGNNNNNTSSSKYDNISILVDYDVILWGKFKTVSNDNDNYNSNSNNGSLAYNVSSSKTRTSIFGSIKGSKSSKDDNFESRKDMINHKFVSSRLGNEPLKLPFSFKLRHISDNSSVPLPSSYKNGKCLIEYFLYATIHRPWPSRNSVRVIKLRVLQKIKIDIPKYIESLEEKRIKELKFMKYIKKGIIEMKAKIPQKAYCHRENIPIEINVNHLGMNKTIIGFAVGLYEKCSYEDSNTKKFVNYSFKLLSERFYEYQVKPGEDNNYTVLNFPIIDGYCSIQRKFLKSNNSPKVMPSISSSNAGSEESVRNERKESLRSNNEIITEDDELIEEEEEKDVTKIQLKDAKIPFISPTINETSRWPIKVEHKLRVVAITNEHAKKIIQKIKGDDKSSNDELSQNENDNEPANNDYEEYVETDSQINIHISPPSSPNPTSSNDTISNQNNANLNSEQSLNEPRRMSYMGGNSNSKDQLNMQYVENQKYINENKKYGIILNHLSNGDTPTLPKSKKKLDIEFDIVIGTMTRNARIFGKEFKLDEEIEDQYFNAILRNSNVSSRLKLVNNPTQNGSIPKITQKIEESNESDILVHSRVRTDSSNDSLNANAVNNLNKESTSNVTSPVLTKASLNKELPQLPKKDTKDSKEKSEKKKITVLPQQPPSLPPRTNASTSTPPYQPIQPEYQPMQPEYPPIQLEYPPIQPEYPPIQPEYQYQYFPNMPQYTNPQEYVPSAPTLDDLETPPPPYEFDPNSQTQYRY